MLCISFWINHLCKKEQLRHILFLESLHAYDESDKQDTSILSNPFSFPCPMAPFPRQVEGGGRNSITQKWTWTFGKQSWQGGSSRGRDKTVLHAGARSKSLQDLWGRSRDATGSWCRVAQPLGDPGLEVYAFLQGLGLERTCQELETLTLTWILLRAWMLSENQGWVCSVYYILYWIILVSWDSGLHCSQGWS